MAGRKLPLGAGNARATAFAGAALGPMLAFGLMLCSPVAAAPLGTYYSASVSGSVVDWYAGGVSSFSNGTGLLTPAFEAESQAGLNWSVDARANDNGGGTVEANAHLTVPQPGVEAYANQLNAASVIKYVFMIAGTAQDPLVPVLLQAGGGVAVSSGGGWAMAGLDFVHNGIDDQWQAFRNYGPEGSQRFDVNQIYDLQPGQIYSASIYAEAASKMNYVASDNGVGQASASVDPTFTIQGADAQLYHFVGLPDSAIGGTSVAAVPEPGTWALLLAGFGIIGGAIRRGRKLHLCFAGPSLFGASPAATRTSFETLLG